MCLIDREITYNRAGEGQQETAANQFDTPETVDQIAAHNVVFNRTCPRPVQPEG